LVRSAQRGVYQEFSFLTPIKIGRSASASFHGAKIEAQQDFDRCLALNKNLRQSLERLIAETEHIIAKKLLPSPEPAPIIRAAAITKQ